MLRIARTLGVSRVAAALVALALSGAPGLASLHARGREHRCTCKAGGRAHECACPVCHAAARRADEERLPPCHREAARQPAPARSAERAAAPCWTGSCGDREDGGIALSPLDAFTLPAATRLAAPRLSGRIAPERPSGHELLLAPETPPPRRA